MSGTWINTATGNPANVQSATPGADSYVGYDGATPPDNVDGEGGNDTLAGNAGDDFMSGGGGDDQVRGGDGADRLFGDAVFTSDPDFVPGNDLLSGGAGADELFGMEGDDSLFGGADDDKLTGSLGNDSILGESGIDTVFLEGEPSTYTWTAATIGGFEGWLVADQDSSEYGEGTDFVAGVEFASYRNFGSSEPTIEAIAAPCFAAGTRIMTASGEVAVEALRAGDMVVTLGLQGPWLRPVRWIGRRSVDCRRHPRPAAVLPVRILAGALGPGVPRRDLVVSPDHALYLDGVLVPAAALIDGSRVVRDSATRRVRYFHIELDAHDVLLAEGTPAESWLDCDNRGQFDNAGLVVALHADFAAAGTGAGGCAPRVEAGAALERIRLRLARLPALAGTVRLQA